MNALLAALLLITGLAVAFALPEHGPAAVLVCAVLGTAAVAGVHGIKLDRKFLMQVFAAGLLVRVLVGSLIYGMELQPFFGADYSVYDNWGYLLLMTWRGETQYAGLMDQITAAGSGWGMNYLVAAVYAVIGRNTLAIQYINAVVGAATAPVIYLCAHQIFQNRRVARISALAVGFYPSLVLWSSQGLKDGPIVFLLALCMLATLKLGERLSAKYLGVLLLGLFGIFSLRFYIFYMLVTAIAGALIFGMRPEAKRNVLREFAIIISLGAALTYMGVLRSASVHLETFGSLERVQVSRADLARSADSGYGRDTDVSTVGGALTAIPIGMLYLLFAPFPWQMANLRQTITLPEMILWWGSLPVLIVGLWFTLKYRLRQTLPILLFTSMLTLTYSVMQGNVGTAYRQRAQLLVFYFIFVAVGYALLREHAEDRRARARALKARSAAARPPAPRDATAAGRAVPAARWEPAARELPRGAGN